MLCPKCHYQRRPTDQAPDWQCPNCGVVYTKAFRAAGASRHTDAPMVYKDTSKKSKFSFKMLRIIVLLIILVMVALQSWLTTIRTTDWQDSLWVVVYPINADNSPESHQYINSISSAEFEDIEEFFSSETKRYGIGINNPIDIKLGSVIEAMPPLPPENRSVLKTVLWSLQLRYWSMAIDKYTGPEPDIRVFVLYHKAEKNKVLPHSTALQKGMVSVVHAFADERVAERNNFVIAHELLHTLGASDKYDLQTSYPYFPDGFADPDLKPAFPQTFAEIMGGRIPISKNLAVMPKRLTQALIGEKTATEIGWR